MLFALLRLALVLALLVVVPGVLLVNALLPPRRSRVSLAERAFLSVGAGMLLLMLVGVVLGFLPHGERGWFSTMGVGFPTLEILLLAVSVGLFWLGLQRGAYPRIASRWPRLLQSDGRAPVAPAGRDPQMR